MINLLVIAVDYPYINNHRQIFLKHNLEQLLLYGLNITVVAPQSITSHIKNKNKLRPFKLVSEFDSKSYLIYSPLYVSFSNIVFLNGLRRYLFYLSVLNTIRIENLHFDFIYSHFLDMSSYSSYKLSKKYNVKYSISLGESELKYNVIQALDSVIMNAETVIFVSTFLRNRVLSNLKLNQNALKNSVILPNGVNKNVFHKILDSQQIRENKNLNHDDFIISFVGAFEEAKGIRILDEALIKMKNKRIKAIYIGEGSYSPLYSEIIYKGILTQSEINEFLNLSDVFVLPTIREGSSNAIIEAMAAGLPIISSNMEFNDDILDDNNSLRINPNSVNELILQLNKIIENPIIANKMSQASLLKSMDFDLINRSKRLMEIILNDYKK
jgi:teichuronic acid biosynthesis glycosyltransferase TuaC